MTVHSYHFKTPLWDTEIRKAGKAQWITHLPRKLEHLRLDLRDPHKAGEHGPIISELLQQEGKRVETEKSEACKSVSLGSKAVNKETLSQVRQKVRAETWGCHLNSHTRIRKGCYTISFIYVWMFYIHVYMCTTNMPSDFKDQKKVSNSLGYQFKLPCGCWEQNSGTLQMQSVFSCQPSSPAF